MHVLYLCLEPDPAYRDPETYINSSQLHSGLFSNLIRDHSAAVSVVLRTPHNKSLQTDNIDYTFIKDELESILRWWQEPEKVFQHIHDLNPDIIILRGLNLPLQFRWLRRIVGENTVIIGEHTGEDTWANRNLWLQQFGLRVVDGFIFKKVSESHPWTKASVILETQPITEIDLHSKDHQNTAKSLINFLNQLLTMKESAKT